MNPSPSALPATIPGPRLPRRRRVSRGLLSLLVALAFVLGAPSAPATASDPVVPFLPDELAAASTETDLGRAGCSDATETVEIWYTRDGWAPGTTFADLGNTTCELRVPRTRSVGRCWNWGTWCQTDNCGWTGWRNDLHGAWLRDAEASPGLSVQATCQGTPVRLTLWGASGQGITTKARWIATGTGVAPIRSAPALDLGAQQVVAVGSGARSEILRASRTETAGRYGPRYAGQLVRDTFPVTPSRGDAAFAVLGTDGSIRVGGQDGRIALYARGTTPDGNWWKGAPPWELDSTDGDLHFTAPAVGDDGTIWVGSWGESPLNQARVFAFAPDGTQRCWTGETGDEVCWIEVPADPDTQFEGLYGPVVGPDGTIHFVTEFVEPTRGSTLISIRRDAGGAVTATFADVLDPAELRVTTAPIVDGSGRLYTGCENWDLGGGACAFAADGSTIWFKPVGWPGAPRLAPVLDARGNLFIAAGPRLYALSKSDGAILGQYQPAGPGPTTAAAVAADGTIYVGAGHRFYALAFEAARGFLRKWDVVFSANRNLTAPTIGPDGTVYVGSEDGNLYAVLGSAPPARSEWPMFGRDERHTQRALALLAAEPPAVAFGDLSLGDTRTLAVRLDAGELFTDVEVTGLSIEPERPEFRLLLPPDLPAVPPLDVELSFEPTVVGRLDVALIVEYTSPGLGAGRIAVPLSGRGKLAAATLLGTVSDAASEAPIAGVRVALRPVDPDDPTDLYRATTDADGRYEIPDVARGTYRSWVETPGFNVWYAAVEVGDAAELRLDFRLHRPGAARRPTIDKITSGHLGKVFYVHGKSFPVTLEVKVDWGDYPVGRVHFQWPRGESWTVEGDGAPRRAFDVGVDFGVCGRLQVRAVSRAGAGPQDVVSSEWVVADFTVMPTPPWVPNPDRLELTKLPGGFRYARETDPIKLFGESLLGLPDVPLLSKKPLEMKYVPKMETTCGSGGRCTLRMAWEDWKLKEWEVKRASGQISAEQARKVFNDLVRHSKDLKNVPEMRGGGIDFALSPLIEVESAYRDTRCATGATEFATLADVSGYVGVSGEFSAEKAYHTLLWAGPVPIPVFVKGELKAGAELLLPVAAWTDGDGVLFFNVRAVPKVSGKGTLGAGLDSIVAVEGFVGGGANLGAQWPQDPLIYKVEIYFEGGARAYAWIFEWDSPKLRWEWTYDGYTDQWLQGWTGRQVERGAEGGFMARPAARNYLERRRAPDTATQPPGARSIETVPGLAYGRVVEGEVFPYSEPALASSFDPATGKARVLAAWVDDRGMRGAFDRTQLAVADWDEEQGTFAAPRWIADDGTADFRPAPLAFPDGTTLVAWENQKYAYAEPDPSAPDYPEQLEALWDAMRRNLEISVARQDTAGAWSSPAALEADFGDGEDHLDHSPRLAGGSADDVLLIWLANEHDALRASADAPDSVWFSRWDGGGWSAPARVADVVLADDEGLARGVPLSRLALAYDGARGLVVLALDMDGDVETLTDRELYSLRYAGAPGAWPDGLPAGSWSGLERLTTNDLLDEAPQLALDREGRFVLAWLRAAPAADAPAVPGEEGAGGFASLVTARAAADTDWTFRLDAPDSVRVAWSESEYSTNLADFELAASAGRLALVWAQPSSNSSDLFAAHYDETSEDPRRHAWSVPKPLTNEPATAKRHLSAALRGTGELFVVFDETDLALRELTTPSGESIGVAPDPFETVDSGRAGEEELGALRRTFLNFVHHTSGEDLAIADGRFYLAPLEPSPGAPVTLIAEVSNPGEVVLTDVPVRFSRDGVEIGTVVLDALTPGELRSVELAWSAPSGAAELVAEVDPELLTNDRDRSNNRQVRPFGLADLTVDNVGWQSADAGRFAIHATIVNRGAVRVDGAVVSFRRPAPGGPGSGPEALSCSRSGVAVNPGDFATLDLGPAESAEVSLVYQRVTDDRRFIDLCILVDETDTVRESNESNNGSRVRIAINNPPQADAGPDLRLECAADLGAPARLDGSASSDVDSTPGTQDDLFGFEWLEAGTSVAQGAAAEIECGLGEHEFTLVVTDGAGETASDAVAVVVEDTTPPWLALPVPVTAECAGPAGTAVETGAPAADDDCCGAGVEVTGDAPALFAPGETAVRWTAVDCHGLAAEVAQTVSVVDTTPPALAPPAAIVAECAGPAGTPVEVGAASASDACCAGAVQVSHDAPERFPLGLSGVAWRVVDCNGLATAASQAVLVADTLPPAGAVTWPSDRACFGGSAGPIGIVDSFADVCDPALARLYEPGPGPSYDGHGDHDVRLTAVDGSGNAAIAAARFTIDTVDPTVSILEPKDGAMLSAKNLPQALRFVTLDDDGASGTVVHEVIRLRARAGGSLCTVFDGATYGDGDGLLSDEDVRLSLAAFCDVTARCGSEFYRLWQPELVVEAVDCGGNVAATSARLGGGLKLRPGPCGGLLPIVRPPMARDAESPAAGSVPEPRR